MKGMTCREFDEVVHAFVRMELLEVTVREAAVEHAARCQLCAQRLSDAAALAEASEILGRSARELEAPAHMEAALVAAFRNHHRRAAWRRGVHWASMGAVAAVLLIFLWTSAGRSKQQSTPMPKKDGASQSASPLDARAPTNALPGSVGADANADVSLVNEAPSDFVPVPFTGGIAADDPGMIVRVQLTRASLAELGYPVAETPDEGLIVADVLVGEDGWPRGVKIVQ